ncbi:MAG: GAF domain-containing protein, partial [Acidobacteria bacterium]|nr:GAF domain-containing protein [Acidobacteriota bacterium]
MNETSRDVEPAGTEFQGTLSAVCEAAVTLARGKYENVEHSGMVIFDDDLRSGTVRAEYPPEVGALGEVIPLAGVAREEALVAKADPIVVTDVDGEESLGPVKEILVCLGVKSIVIVPVIVDGRVKGSFSFDSLSARHEFTPEEVEYCRAFAHFASYVVQNAYLLSEKRTQAHNLEALREAMLAITAEHGRAPLLHVRAIIEQAVRLLGATGGGIYEYDSRREVLEVIFDSSRPQNFGVTLKAGADVAEGMAGQLLMNGDPYLETEDYSQWVGRADVFERDVPFGSVIEVPLLWQGEPRGVLYVDDVKGRKFTPEDAGLLGRFAAAASIALQHGKLAERDQYMLSRLERLATATNEIIGSLNTETGGEMGRLSADFPNDQLTLIAKYAREILSAEACGIHQVKEPGWLTLVASHGHSEGGFQKNRKFEIKSGRGTGLTGHIAFEKQVFRKCGAELINHPAVAN